MLHGKQISEIVAKRFRTNILFKAKSNSQGEFRLADLPKNEGFFLKLQQHWKRISCETVLEPFSKPFLHGIESAPIESKRSFENLYLSFSKNNKFNLFVNQKDTSIEEFKNTSHPIASFQIKKEIKNIDFEEKNSEEVIKICSETIWQIFCLMMVFLHKQILEAEDHVKEGSEKIRSSKEYERNQIYRDIVIALKGTICSVCDLQFEERYGAYGKDFIEVHHTVPVCDLNENYRFDPINDLVPVCSNCHSIIHRREIPYTIAEMRSALMK